MAPNLARLSRGTTTRLLLLVPLFLLPMACGRTAVTPQAPAPGAQVTTPAPVQPTTVPPQEPASTEPAGATQPASTTPAGSLAPGDSSRSLVFDGLERTYTLHIPAGYDAAKPTPLVLAFHGLGLDAAEMIRISGLNAQADTSGFIVAYPDGTGDTRSWNGGHCCSDAAISRTDDVGFTGALIEAISTLANIDPARVYATGFSNGAIMVYRLGCELADRIAAIGPVSATQVLNDQQACSPARSMPVIHFHGTADRLNPYNGWTNKVGLRFISVDEAIGFWTQLDGCPADPQTSQTGTIRHDVYTGCAGGASVELYTIQDGEHAWPGGQAVSPQVGEPITEISASPLMWEFFAAHPLP